MKGSGESDGMGFKLVLLVIDVNSNKVSDEYNDGKDLVFGCERSLVRMSGKPGTPMELLITKVWNLRRCSEHSLPSGLAKSSWHPLTISSFPRLDASKTHWKNISNRRTKRQEKE